MKLIALRKPIQFQHNKESIGAKLLQINSGFLTKVTVEGTDSKGGPFKGTWLLADAPEEIRKVVKLYE
jgi:hypothetical protein